MPTPTWEAGTGRLHALIDTPRGSRLKYKFDEGSGLIRVVHALPEGLQFPFDFGWVPGTRADDGDPLDILVIHDTAGFPGCLMTVRLLGVLRASQLAAGKRQRNDRLLGALDTERSPSRLRRLGQVEAGRLQAIAGFFETYNRLEGREFRATRWEGAGAARIVIRRAQRRQRQEMPREMPQEMR